MGIRTTVALVKEIINTTEEVSPFIRTASILVDEKLDAETSITDAHKKEIETWLAAHFLAMSLDRQGQQERIGATQITYSGKGGEGLKATTYGQTALMLDTTGTLSRIGKKKARIDVIEAIDAS